MSPAAKSAHIPAPQLMTTLAGELERMREIGTRIEISLCQLASSAADQGEWLDDVQQLDLLLQQLAALRDFVGAAACAEGAAQASFAMGEALDQVLLHDLRARLSGEQAEAQESGDLMLFDGDCAS